MNTPAAQTQPAGGMSPQTRTWIAVGALVACLIIGGGIVFWMVFGASPGGGEVIVESSKPNNLRGRSVIQPRVTQLGDADWAVRGDVGGMRVSKDGSSGRKLAFTYQTGLLGLSQESINLLSGRFRIINDAAMAKAWGVTPEQTEKLKQMSVGGGGTLKPSKDDQAALRKLWDDYESASDKAGPQKQLVEKLDQVAKANLEPAKKSMQERIDQIRQILTPEQIQKITK